mmetsp:Transcript_14034/g.28909  ORF Transcript_14034/g.28909 Transcript_14034/m.28909 type:complete len:253 (+) Transcript_14034:1493-2251(+)
MQPIRMVWTPRHRRVTFKSRGGSILVAVAVVVDAAVAAVSMTAAAAPPEEDTEACLETSWRIAWSIDRLCIPFPAAAVVVVVVVVAAAVAAAPLKEPFKGAPKIPLLIPLLLLLPTAAPAAALDTEARLSFAALVLHTAVWYSYLEVLVAEAAACCKTEPVGATLALKLLAATPAACVEALWVAGLKLQAAHTWMCVRTVSSGYTRTCSPTPATDPATQWTQKGDFPSHSSQSSSKASAAGAAAAAACIASD